MKTTSNWEVAVKATIGRFGGVKRPGAINVAERFLIMRIDMYGPLFGISIDNDDPDYQEWFYKGGREEYLTLEGYLGCC